jgi:hypothetical protein
VSLIICKQDDEPMFKYNYKIYFDNNETYTFLDIIDYSNITLAWGILKYLEITWINNDTCA